MPDINVQAALSNTFYQALNRYCEGGLTEGGGIAGIQRPELDRFDASGTQLIKSDEPALQTRPDDYKDPASVTTTTVVDGKPKNHVTAPPQDPQLNTFLQGLADKLSTQPGITYMVPGYVQSQIDPAEVSSTEKAFAAENYPSDVTDESPQLRDQRNQIRADIAKASSGAVSADPEGYLRTALGMISDDGVKSAVQKALTDAAHDLDGGQSQFFSAPSSSTGKYHPADEINVGGLALHSLRDVEMGSVLCDVYGVKGLERDEVLGALAVHDIEKGGANWNGYAGDHGPQGQAYLDHIWGVDSATPDDVAHPEAHMAVLVGRHMAQWNQGPPAPGTKSGGKDPLVPRNIDEQLVSWGDYLGALDNVYINAPNTPGKAF